MPSSLGRPSVPSSAAGPIRTTAKSSRPSTLSVAIGTDGAAGTESV